MSEPTMHTRIALEAVDTGGRPRRGSMQPKRVREFTVYTSQQDPGTQVRADKIETVGDWFTLYLDGEPVYGAPRQHVLQYIAKPVGEAA